jgi:hypothetical protein
MMLPIRPLLPSTCAMACLLLMKADAQPMV